MSCYKALNHDCQWVLLNFLAMLDLVTLENISKYILGYKIWSYQKKCIHSSRLGKFPNENTKNDFPGD